MPVSQAPRKKKPGKARNPKTTTMKELKDLQANCYAMLAATAQFSPYLRNQALVNAGDIESISNYSKILSRDIVQMRTELDNLIGNTPAKLNANDGEDMMKGLMLGESYAHWIEKYERVIAPTIQSLTSLLVDAANNLKAQSGEDINIDVK